MTRWDTAERVGEALCAVSLPPRTRIRVCLTMPAPHAADVLDAELAQVRAALTTPAAGDGRVTVHGAIHVGAGAEEVEQWALALAARLDARRIEELDRA